jgi:acetate kinase
VQLQSVQIDAIGKRSANIGRQFGESIFIAATVLEQRIAKPPQRLRLKP